MILVGHIRVGKMSETSFNRLYSVRVCTIEEIRILNFNFNINTYIPIKQNLATNMIKINVGIRIY